VRLRRWSPSVAGVETVGLLPFQSLPVSILAPRFDICRVGHWLIDSGYDDMAAARMTRDLLLSVCVCVCGLIDAIAVDSFAST